MYGFLVMILEFDQLYRIKIKGVMRKRTSRIIERGSENKEIGKNSTIGEFLKEGLPWPDNKEMLKKYLTSLKMIGAFPLIAMTMYG